MAQLNTRSINTARTYEGAPAIPSTKLQELRRAVCAGLLWEASFYESGEDLGLRIMKLVHECDPYDVALLAREARHLHHLRHMPLLLTRELVRRKDISHEGIAALLDDIILRADEPAEFLALYWAGNKDQSLSGQVKKGLARALTKFDGYQLAKYNRDKEIKLRDVIRLVHPKPKDELQAKHFKQILEGTLPSPDTWEVQLSAGADKKETFCRLINENKLGYLALLRNLRNMEQAGVDHWLINEALAKGDKTRILPFRFIAAAKAAPQFEAALDAQMCQAMSYPDVKRLQGRTNLLVDVSGSMDQALSAKSDLTRIDAACGLAILVRGICKDVRVFTFSQSVVEVPARQGMALRDTIKGSQPHSSTYLGRALEEIGRYEADRTIVITDEQSADAVGGPQGKGYMLNVASYQNGVGYGPWTRVNGFSENVVRYIQAYEELGT